MSEKSTGTITFHLHPDKPPQLTSRERERLTSMRDEDIDFSDAPLLRHNASPIKANLVMLEADVFEFFRGNGIRPNAAHINAALREYMAAHPKTS